MTVSQNLPYITEAAYLHSVWGRCGQRGFWVYCSARGTTKAVRGVCYIEELSEDVSTVNVSFPVALYIKVPEKMVSLTREDFSTGFVFAILVACMSVRL